MEEVCRLPHRRHPASIQEVLHRKAFPLAWRFGRLHPRTGGGSVEPIMTTPSSSSLADVIDTILDKGLVIDAYVRVSIVGIELLTVDARIVVASVDTYLRFAEAVNRLNISEQDPQSRPAGTDRRRHQ